MFPFGREAGAGAETIAVTDRAVKKRILTQSPTRGLTHERPQTFGTKTHNTNQHIIALPLSLPIYSSNQSCRGPLPAVAAAKPRRNR